jgi:hypothetical protein
MRDWSEMAARHGGVALLFAMLACAPKAATSDARGGSGGAAGAAGGNAGTGAGAASTGGRAPTGAGGTASSGGNAGTGTGGAFGGAAGAAAGSAGQGGPGGRSAGGGRPADGNSGGGSNGAPGTASFQVKAQLASVLNSAAPGTIGIVTWTANVTELVDAHIDFGLDVNYGMTAPVDVTVADHRTLLLGMKPAKTYHFRVVARDAGATYTSGDNSLVTGPAATTVSVAKFQVMNAAARKPGFIITSYWQGAGSAVPFILDADGDIVWWGRNGPADGIARARMSADGKNMWMTTAGGSGHPIQRLSMDTLEAQTYSNAIGSHDLTPVSGATMAFLEYGESDCDSIFEIDPSGTKREVFEAQGIVSGGGCHGNAVRYSPKEDLYTYSDVGSDVYVVNRTGALQWRLSEKVSGGNSSWGGRQHGHQLLDGGILIFANNGTSANASAMFEYSLTGTRIRTVSTGDFTANLGDVQRLPGGNTLVTFSNAGVIKEIDSQGSVVVQINAPTGNRFGYALWQDSLYGPPADFAQ